MDKLKIFVCGFLDEQMSHIPDASHLIKVNLSKLDVGEFQSDQICEHRIYLTDLPEKTDAEYVGFMTWRWFEKFKDLISLEEMINLDFKPSKVYCGHLWEQWHSQTIMSHWGIGKYLYELSEYMNLPLNEKITFTSNQFICHKNVYLEWQKVFRDALNHFHAKYKFNYDFYIWDIHKNRQAGAFYERISMLYFSNRNDLEFVQIPFK